MKRDTEQRGDGKWDTETIAASYDELTARTVPDMESFYGAVTDALPEESEKVLELGCGTGILTGRIRRTHPDAALTSIDRSAAMLAVARQKPDIAGITLIEGDIMEPWPDDTYDAVVSTFCIIAFNQDVQLSLLRRMHTVLHPGGVCITGCVVRPENTKEEQRQLNEWEIFMQDAGLDPEEILRQKESWNTAGDHIPTSDTFQDMLKEAGFTHIRCTYNRGLYAVFVGER